MAVAALGKLNLVEPPPIWGSRSVDCFEKLKQIGFGTYGEVYIAREIGTGEIVALKKIRMDNEREGCYMRQFLIGLHYCHANRVLHRDIKGSNILIDNKGNLKLADFRLARSFSLEHTGNFTNQVITLCYSPPELLLGATKYGPAVDMWSVGCLFAELLNGKPILPGKTVIDQLRKIYLLCGSPDENNWPGVSKMPWYERFNQPQPLKRRVRDTYGHFDGRALELLEYMLVLDPSKRISAKDALDSDYFRSDPLPPCDPKRQRVPCVSKTVYLETKKKQKSMPPKGKAARKQKLKRPDLR